MQNRWYRLHSVACTCILVWWCGGGGGGGATTCRLIYKVIYISLDLTKLKSHLKRVKNFNAFRIFPATEVVLAALSLVWSGPLLSHHSFFFTETSFMQSWPECWGTSCISTFQTFDPSLGGLGFQPLIDKRVYVTNISLCDQKRWLESKGTILVCISGEISGSGFRSPPSWRADFPLNWCIC